MTIDNETWLRNHPDEVQNMTIPLDPTLPLTPENVNAQGLPPEAVCVSESPGAVSVLPPPVPADQVISPTGAWTVTGPGASSPAIYPVNQDIPIPLTTLPTGAQKDLGSKPRVDLVPLDVLECLCRPLELGMLKGYQRDNWVKGIPFRTSKAAVLRHLSKFFDEGQDYDKESLEKFNFKVAHIDMALFNLMSIALQFKRGRVDLDDRV